MVFVVNTVRGRGVLGGVVCRARGCRQKHICNPVCWWMLTWWMPTFHWRPPHHHVQVLAWLLFSIDVRNSMLR